MGRWNSACRRRCVASSPVGCTDLLWRALAAAAAFVATHDPSAAGTRYPGCVFHQMTGLWCPGCGLTRGTTSCCASPRAALVTTCSHLWRSLWSLWRGWDAEDVVGRPPIRVPHSIGRWLAVTAPALALVYTVLRNLPSPATLPRALGLGLPGIGLGGGTAAGEDRVDAGERRLVERHVEARSEAPSNWSMVRGPMMGHVTRLDAVARQAQRRPGSRRARRRGSPTSPAGDAASRCAGVPAATADAGGSLLSTPPSSHPTAGSTE